jgi:glucokinase
MRILAGDIGGTNTRLVYLDDDVAAPSRYEKTFVSADYDGVVEVIEAFLTGYEIKRSLDVACLAVAGPVISGAASLTNLPWKIAEKALGGLLKTKHAYLINDLVAAGFAIPFLDESALVTIKEAGGDPHSRITTGAVVIGVGTGLGAAHLVCQDDHYQVLSSEAGHAAFAPSNEIQCRLLNWIQQQHAHVSVELLLSGRGIYTLYQFFRDEAGLPESPSIAEALQSGDPAQLISAHALAADDPLCEQALSCFIDIYAAVIGDIALHYYPLDAVYLVGGIPAKILPLLMSKKNLIAALFCNKGLMYDNLQQLPIKLIIDDSVGLNGAIAYARHHMNTTQ